jgi:tRNA G18 (ribose-2'-O)-methylase SpoU
MKYVMLYDIRSHYNVGAIFRTCDGAGVDMVFLAGYTPAPIDRFGRAVPEIHKTALGAECTVPFEVVATEGVPQCLALLQAKGVRIVVVEQAPQATMLADFIVPESVLYIFGSETEGVPPDIIALADVVLELPMAGVKESLNVSVTAGIVLYHT